MSSVVLFGKPGCCLCDDAKQVLVQSGIEFSEVDITTNSALKAELGVFIPVVEVDGRMVFEAGMNPALLPDLIGLD